MAIQQLDFKQILKDIEDIFYTNYKRDMKVYLAESFKNNTKYEWCENDCEYDSSGSINDTREAFAATDYETIKDFSEEYNGKSTPSYESGCGIYYDTYDTELDNLIKDLASQKAKEDISLVLKVDTESEEICDLFMENEIYDDLIFEIECRLNDLKEELYDKPFTTIFFTIN